MIFYLVHLLTPRTEQSPSDLIAAGNTPAMDRAIAAAVGPGDDHPKVVSAHGTVAGEIDSHTLRITARFALFNRAVYGY